MNGMTARQWLPLMSIVIGVFIFNMSEFVPIGLLTGISTDFGISESRAGLLISFYAWAVAILSLPIMLLLKKMEYRRMLILCVLLFVVFQFMSGISANYWMLMASRIGVAVAHSIFWSIAPQLATKVVPPEIYKLALSMVATGTSVAMIVGLPVGRVIGLALGWRMAFVTIALVSVTVLLLIVAVFPRVENPGTFTVRRMPEVYHNRVLVCIYVIVAIYVTGVYTAYSYIEPFLQQSAGLSESMTTVALIVFGAAGFVGSYLFAKKSDGHRFGFILAAFGGVTVSLFLFQICASISIMMFVICAFWGMLHTCYNVSFQNETIIASTEDNSAITMALFSGIYNIGIAMGSIVGGVVLDVSSVGNIGFVGCVFTLVAFCIAMFVLIPSIKRKAAVQ